MEERDKKLRELIREWAKSETKYPKSVKKLVVTSEDNDIIFLSTECDNDNGMTLYDHLYNGY